MTNRVRNKNGGYATFPNRWVDAGYMAAAPGSVTQVYLFLCRWADNSSQEASQTIAMIGKKAGLTEKVVQTALRTLEQWGVVEREYSPGRGQTNTFLLNELPQRCPPYPPTKYQLNTPAQSTGVSNTGVFSGGALSTCRHQPEENQPEETTIVVQEKKRRIAYPEPFESFWSEYPPGHGSKKAAFDVWKGLGVDDEMYAAIMDGVAAWKLTRRWQDGFIKDAERFLKHRMWENPEPPAAKNGHAAPLDPNEPPENYGVTWNPARHFGTDGRKVFQAEVAAAQQAWEAARG